MSVAAFRGQCFQCDAGWSRGNLPPERPAGRKINDLSSCLLSSQDPIPRQSKAPKDRPITRCWDQRIARRHPNEWKVHRQGCWSTVCRPVQSKARRRGRSIACQGRSIARRGSSPPDELIAHPEQWMTIARQGRSIARLGSSPPDELTAHPDRGIARLSGTIARRRSNKGQGHLGQRNFVPKSAQPSESSWRLSVQSPIPPCSAYSWSASLESSWLRPPAFHRVLERPALQHFERTAADRK